MRAYMRHMDQLNLCHRGCRQFAKLQGISWTAFVNNGISIERLRKTGDAFALKVVSLVESESAAKKELGE